MKNPVANEGPRRRGRCCPTVVGPNAAVGLVATRFSKQPGPPAGRSGAGADLTEARARWRLGGLLLAALTPIALILPMPAYAQTPTADDFNPGAGNPQMVDRVYSLAVQADGKILVGGEFTTLGGQPRHHLARLNADGTLDPTFNPRAEGGNSPFVDSLVVQADGKILVGGRFRTLGGQPRDSLGRLNADGTLDTSFYPKVGIFAPHVHCLVVQADGKILVGGEFTMLGGQPRDNLGRLNNTAPATQSLRYDGVTITWLRGDTSPKVWRTTFDYSTDGVFWTSLGDGIRIPGGWQLTGVALPVDGTLRARGFATGGRDNASSGFVESLATKTNGLPAGHTSGMPRRVVMVGEQPQLEAFLSPNGEPALILYASPGSTNTLEFTSGLGPATTWTAGQTVVLPTNALFEVVQPIGITNNAVFIRAVRE